MTILDEALAVVDDQQRVLDKLMEEYKATGRCDPHFGLPLWGPASGPLHGCLVCGKPVA